LAHPVVLQQRPPLGSWMIRRNITTMVFASDIYNNVVDIFDFNSGQQIGQIGGLSQPQGLATDTNGNLYEADTNTQHINIYAPYSVNNPTVIDESGVNGGEYPVGLHVDKHLNLWVANICSNGCGSPGNVMKYPYGSSTGTALNGGPSRAYFVTTDSSGNVWADGEDSNGAPIYGYWAKGAGSFIPVPVKLNFPGSVQFDAYGHMILDDQLGDPATGYSRVDILNGGMPPATRHITVQTTGDDVVTVAIGTANARLFAPQLFAGTVNKIAYWPPSTLEGALTPTTPGELLGSAVVQATLP
jgi:hypothetical protein